jgi:dihydrodipicolinate synthase/N-acetylneuraminate lyase
MGAQTTSTLELWRLIDAAGRLGADYVQVSPPFYFAHTEDDFYEYVLAAAEAAESRVGLIVYNTYWTSIGGTSSLVERLVDIPSVVGLKWSTPEYGQNDVRADRQSLLIAIRDHRQPAALRVQPHSGCARDRDSCRQLLARVGRTDVAAP